MNKFLSFVFTLVFLGVVSSCKEEEPPLPDNLVVFESAEQGLDANTKTLTVKLKLTRATDVAIPISVQITPTGLTYGTEFTTAPAASNNTISLTIPAQSSEASFQLSKTDNVFLSGTESITFKIASATSPILIGDVSQLTVKFSSIVSSGSNGNFTLNGLIGAESGASAGNAVYVDFSNNQAYPVARSSWDLGFFSGSDFRVILNNTTSAGAKVLTKTSLAEVVAADTVGLTLAINQAAPSPSDFAYFDDIAGDLSKTAIPAVSATEADNKVIIINRGTGGGIAARAWKKIRILRNASGGYTLQYANINETTFKTIDIAKDDTYNFKYVSFDKGAVEVEPKKKTWDIQWTYSVFTFAFGGSDVPYNFSDLVSINYLGGVEVAEVLTSTVSYDNYGEANIASSTFSKNRWAIGSNWRTATSGATVGVKTDRFYIIKDPNGNYYKLKFISFHPSEGGTRGRPIIDYKLVKKA